VGKEMHHKINYLEIPAKNIALAKQFFVEVFEWEFKDYGPEYTCFEDAGMMGGFYKADLSTSTKTGSALIVLYSQTLEKTQARVEHAGGSITKEIFSFPGGRRFHFTDLNDNEFAVWSE